MSDTIPLDEQIVAALTGNATSDQAADVLADAERTLASLSAEADAADVASLSPLATATEARTLRQKAADIRFDADRMDASVSALRARVDELKRAEDNARRDAKRAEALKLRDDLAAEIADVYPGIVAKLTDLTKRIQESDRLCALNGINQSAESIGRGVPANFYIGGGPVVRLANAQVPMPGSTRLAWESTMNGWQWFGLQASDDARL